MYEMLKLFIVLALLFPPLSFVKIARETLQSYFIFGPIDRAGWDLTLAQKRMGEASALKDHNFKNLAKQQLNLAKQDETKAYGLIESLRGKTDINYLEDTYKANEQEIKNLENK